MSTWEMLMSEKKGLCLLLKNGEKDWYDPVSYPDGLTETLDQFIIDNGHAIYEVDKALVQSVSWYELCPACGKEVEKDKICEYCNPEGATTE